MGIVIPDEILQSTRLTAAEIMQELAREKTDPAFSFDFQSDLVRAGDAVALSSEGRRGFFRAYELRMDTLVTHPLFNYRVSYRRLLEIQTRLLAKLIDQEIAAFPRARARGPIEAWQETSGLQACADGPLRQLLPFVVLSLRFFIVRVPVLQMAAFTGSIDQVARVQQGVRIFLVDCLQCRHDSVVKFESPVDEGWFVLIDQALDLLRP